MKWDMDLECIHLEWSTLRLEDMEWKDLKENGGQDKDNGVGKKQKVDQFYKLYHVFVSFMISSLSSSFMSFKF